jgi:hypothetical protein
MVIPEPSGTEIEITPEMIEAGLAALHDEPYIELFRGQAVALIEDIIRRTWKAHASGKSPAS